jgi:hypothetical protein
MGKNRLKGMSGTEVKTHEGELPLNDGPDFDELESERLTSGLGEPIHGVRSMLATKGVSNPGRMAGV